MNDKVFEGASLEDALLQASRLYGVPTDRLRYVRLEGSGPNTRIVILGSAGAPAEPQREADRDPEETIEDIVGALAAAVGSPIHLDVERSEGHRLRLHLSGPGCGVLVERGTGPVKALEELLQKAIGGSPTQPRLRIECEGYRESRDRELRELAARLAQEVRERGTAREAPRLNSYERRLVHVALSSEPGLRTYSTGEGRERRLVVAPNDAAPAPEEPS